MRTRLVALALVLTFVLTPSAAVGQTYGDGSPPGVRQVLVGGQIVSAAGVPTVGAGTLTVSGVLEPGQSEALVTILLQDPTATGPSDASAVLRTAGSVAGPPPDGVRFPLTGLDFSVGVDSATGAFEAPVPARLGEGSYAIYINDALVGQFTVKEAQVDVDTEAAPGARPPTRYVIQGGVSEEAFAIVVALAATLGVSSLILGIWMYRLRS